MQNHYNLIHREEEREMIPFCIDQGIGVIPWSPLARGFLTGNRSRGQGGETQRARGDGFAQKMYYTDVDFAIADRVGDLATRLGVPRGTLALGWMLHRPGITSPVVGVTKVQHVDEAAAAVDLALNATEIQHLEELYRPKNAEGFW